MTERTTIDDRPGVEVESEPEPATARARARRSETGPTRLQVKKTYKYTPEMRLRIYGDDWKWRDDERDRYRWREAHDGPGYWRNGVWIQF